MLDFPPLSLPKASIKWFKKILLFYLCRDYKSTIPFLWCPTDFVKLVSQVYENNFYPVTLSAATSEKIHGDFNQS